MHRERAADRPEHTDPLADLAGGECPESDARELVEQLDPAAARVRAHDGQWTAHRQAGIAGQMREASRLCALRALRRLEPHHILVTFVDRVLEDPSLLEEDRAAGGARREAQEAVARDSITSARTAIRTATPFRT